MLPTGAGSTYTMTWYNITGSVVGTGTVASNLPAGIYTASITGSPGCGNTFANVIIPAYPSSFSLSVAPSITLCGGNTTIVTISQQSTPGILLWSPSAFLSSTNTTSSFIMPTAPVGASVSVNYSVMMVPSYTTCAFQQTFQVTYFNPPVPSVSPVPAFCLNSPTFQASASPGGGWYTSNAVVDSLTGVISPSLGSFGTKYLQYNVQLGGCTNTTAVNFFVNALPPVVTPTLVTICQGNVATLSIGGSNNNAWNGIPGSTLTINPNTNTIYVASSTNAATGCSNSAQVTVSVNPAPVISVAGSGTVCENNQFTLTASGAHTYTWVNVVQNPVYVSSAAAGAYTYNIAGTYTNSGCKTFNFFNLRALPYATVSVTGNTVVCKGDEVIFNASGATSYSWNGMPGSSSYTLSAISNINLMLKGISPDYCADSLSILLLVDQCTGLEKNIPGKEKIFPNPASTELFIESNGNGNASLCDLHGRVLFSREYNAGQSVFSVADITPGVYLLKCSTGKDFEVIKLIIFR